MESALSSLCSHLETLETPEVLRVVRSHAKTTPRSVAIFSHTLRKYSPNFNESIFKQEVLVMEEEIKKSNSKMKRAVTIPREKLTQANW